MDAWSLVQMTRSSWLLVQAKKAGKAVGLVGEVHCDLLLGARWLQVNAYGAVQGLCLGAGCSICMLWRATGQWFRVCSRVWRLEQRRQLREDSFFHKWRLAL